MSTLSLSKLGIAHQIIDIIALKLHGLILQINKSASAQCEPLLVVDTASLLPVRRLLSIT